MKVMMEMIGRIGRIYRPLPSSLISKMFLGPGG